MAWSAQPVVGVRLSFGQVFRPMAYAQAIGVLGFITPLALLFGLWRLVTSVVGLRSMSGCDGGKAVVMLLIGFVVSFVIGLAASPIMLVLMR